LKGVQCRVQGRLLGEFNQSWEKYQRGLTSAFELTGAELQNTERLLPFTVSAGETVIVSSDLGTGKTHQLQAIIDSLPDGATVLGISPRVTLSRDMARRLKLEYYEHVKKSGKCNRFALTGRMAATVNSLEGMINSARKYSLIFIDESELLASHLLGETIKDKDKALSHLLELLKNAERVVCLDAFATSNTAFLLELAGRSSTRTIRNTYRNWKNLPVKLYPKQTMLAAELRATLSAENAGGVLVVTNGEKTAEKLYQEAAASFPDKQFLLITQAHSREPQQAAFLNSPNTEAVRYACIFASPVIESGLSLDTTHIKTVFGVFYNSDGTGTPLGAIQSLARARKATEWHVYTDGRSFNELPTTPAAVMAETVARYRDTVIATGADAGRVDLSANAVARLDNRVIAWENRQKTNFGRAVYAFLQYLEVGIKHVDFDGAAHADGKTILARGKELRAELRTAEVCNAEIIDAQDAAAIIERGATLAESYQLERYRLESEYLEAVSPELVEADREGATLSEIKHTEEAAATGADIKEVCTHYADGFNDYADGKEHAVSKAHGLAFRHSVRSELLNLAGVRFNATGAIIDVHAVSWDYRGVCDTETGKVTPWKNTAWYKLLSDNRTLANACGLGAKLPENWQRTPVKYFGDMLKSCGFSTKSEQIRGTAFPQCEIKNVSHTPPKLYIIFARGVCDTITVSASHFPRHRRYSIPAMPQWTNYFNARAIAGRNWVAVKARRTADVTLDTAAIEAVNDAAWFLAESKMSGNF
jgi:hypothetical protein